MNFSSKLIADAVDTFSQLPGIGKKSALRMVLHLLKQEENTVLNFTQSVQRMHSDIKFCEECFNVSDDAICSICSQESRRATAICVVESIREVIAIESTQQYNGRYHVLGGLISPLDGIGPDNLRISELIERIDKQQTEELIFALSPTLEGDTTTYYISKQLNEKIKITTLSRGVAFGGELEYADEMTLAKSFENRVPLTQVVKNID
jgi:recombination protein RecR